jgi:hypothetical protein
MTRAFRSIQSSWLGFTATYVRTMCAPLNKVGLASDIWPCDRVAAIWAIVALGETGSFAVKACFRRSLQDGLLEVCGHRPGTTRLPKDHFRQSCFSHVFKELGSDALQIGSYCSYPVTGPGSSLGGSHSNTTWAAGVAAGRPPVGRHRDTDRGTHRVLSMGFRPAQMGPRCLAR